MPVQRHTLVVLLTVVEAAAGCGGSRAQGETTPQGEPKVSKSAFAQDYEKQCKDDVDAARAELVTLEQRPAKIAVATVLEPFNQLSRRIDRSVNTAGLYREVHPDAEVRKIADACEQSLQQVVTDI